MKNFTKLMSVILCLLLLFSLCACGENPTETGSANGAKSSEVGKPVSSQNSSPAEDNHGGQTYSLSEYLQSGESIWYQIDTEDGFGKDADVEAAYLFEPDGTFYYASNLNLDDGQSPGKVEQLEDSEIIERIKANHAKKKAKRIEECETQFENKAKSKIKYPIMDFFSNTIDSALYDMEDFDSFSDTVSSILNDPNQNMNDFDFPDFSPVVAELESFYEKYKYVDYLTEEDRQTLSDSIRLYSVYVVLQNMGVTAQDERLMRDTLYDQFCATISSLTDKIYAAMMENIEPDPMWEDPEQPYEYKLTLTTDSTGNNTSTEDILMLVKSKYHFAIGVERLNLIPISPYADEEGKIGNCNLIVYDSRYGGYIISSEDDPNELFVTRTASNINFTLDEASKADLPLDISESSQAEALFEDDKK